jgi:hypothetical protein
MMEQEHSDESSSSSKATDARSDDTLSGSSSSAKSNDLQARRTRAMGDAMQRFSQNKSNNDDQEQCAGVEVNGLGNGWEQDEARNAADVEALDDTSRALLLELRSMVFSERLYAIPPEELEATKQQDVLRARDMLSQQSDVNLNIKVLPYGETLLSAAVRHSVDMIQIFLAHGADPNLENDMASETAYDQVEEYLQEELEDGDENSELQQMKELLLSYGANCFEERMARVQ